MDRALHRLTEIRMGNGEWSRQGLSALLAGSFYMMMIPQQKQKIPFLSALGAAFLPFLFRPRPKALG